MDHKILVINSGSSSTKYKLLAMNPRKALLEGKVEVDQASGDTLAQVSERLRVAASQIAGITAIGHRVVHGGGRLTGPAYLDQDALEAIAALRRYAPLHTDAVLAGVRATAELFPGVSQVGVFDTAFHATLPAHASAYALPREIAAKFDLRRFGFHGISCQHALKVTAEALGLPPTQCNLIVVHLGAGASVTAIEAGASVDTSMGLTPLEGLIMGTRCGDIDPAVPLFLQQDLNMTAGEVYELLNNESGLLGMCGAADMRELHSLVASGHGPATLALEAFCYRVKKYIGAYCAVLGRVDALVFTGGIGENDARVRELVCEGLSSLGIELDGAKNTAPGNGMRPISTTGSPTKMFVVKTDEESEIAEQVLRFLDKERTA